MVHHIDLLCIEKEVFSLLCARLGQAQRANDKYLLAAGLGGHGPS